MRRFLLLVLLIVLGCEEQPSGPLKWRNVGPGGGGWIQSIAMDPRDFDTIHVGCDVGGYYKSTDGGKTFRILNKGLSDYFIERILVDRSDNRIICLATPNGVFKSTDGGLSWSQKREGFPPTKEFSYSAPVGPLVMDPSNRRVLYAGIGRPRRNDGGCGHIYKSTDAGESWRLLDGISKAAKDAVIHQLAIRPDNPKIIFAATDKGVFKSSDAGITWERKERGLPHPFCRNIAVHPRKPDIMYAVMWSTPGVKPWHGGVYRSDDGGESWSARNEGLPQQVAPPGDAPQKTCNYIRFVADPRDPDRIFVGANSWWGAGLYRSVDGGKHWELVTQRGEDSNMDQGWITFWGPSIKCIAYSPLGPGTIVYGDSGRVMRTDDGGGRWKQFYTKETSAGRWQGNGLEVTCLLEIAVDPFDPKKLYCGYADIGLMISEDGGVTWSRCVEGLPSHGDIGRVVCDPERSGVAWCCEGKPKLGKGCVAMTSDGGQTWQVVGSEKTGLPQAATRFLVLDPSSPVHARTLYVVSHRHGVFKSTDGGRAWQPMNKNLGNGNEINVTDLAMDPQNHRRLFAAVRSNAENPYGGLFMTTNGGQTWAKVNEGMEFPDIYSIAINPESPSVVFLACRGHYSHVLRQSFPGGVFRSSDGGRMWECVFEDKFASCVRVSPFDSNVIYIGTTDHPYHDNATGRGVFVSRDGGNTWEQINDGLTVHQVSVITLDPNSPMRIYAGTGGNGLFIGEWK